MESPGPRSPARRNTAGLGRDLELLEILSSPEAVQANGLGVVRVAERAGRDKAVVSRTLATLAETGLLERDPVTLAYRIGPRIYSLAAVTAEATLIRESRPALMKLARATRETAHLCVLRGDHVLTVASELSPHEFRSTGWEGVSTAAWKTPSGRVLLSDWDNQVVRAWYADKWTDQLLVGPLADSLAPRYAPVDPMRAGYSRIHDLDTLLLELDDIRSRGYALFDEELEVGVVGASAPVRDFAGRVVAAVNVSGPGARIGRDLESLGALVVESAGELSARIGG